MPRVFLAEILAPITDSKEPMFSGLRWKGRRDSISALSLSRIFTVTSLRYRRAIDEKAEYKRFEKRCRCFRREDDPSSLWAKTKGQCAMSKCVGVQIFDGVDVFLRAEGAGGSLSSAKSGRRIPSAGRILHRAQSIARTATNKAARSGRYGRPGAEIVRPALRSNPVIYPSCHRLSTNLASTQRTQQCQLRSRPLLSRMARSKCYGRHGATSYTRL